MFNIPADITSLPKDAGNVKKILMPQGAIHGRNDFGFDGYGDPCPPKGDKPHHDHITVFAVDVAMLPEVNNADVSSALGGFDLQFHTMAKASLVGRYNR